MLNDFQIVMLASGSKGNAALISTAKQRFLVDIGISCRALTTRMKEIGVSVNELDGVFITHEHVDHVRGLATFLKNYQVPVYSSALTWRAILAKDSSLVRQNCRLIDNNRLLCGDLDYITGQARPLNANIIMSNNFAFGGINTSLIFKNLK